GKCGLGCGSTDAPAWDTAPRSGHGSTWSDPRTSDTLVAIAREQESSAPKCPPPARLRGLGCQACVACGQAASPTQLTFKLMCHSVGGSLPMQRSSSPLHCQCCKLVVSKVLELFN